MRVLIRVRRRRVLAAAACALFGVALVIPAARAGESSSDFYSIRQIFALPGLTGYSPRLLKWSPNGTRLSFLLGRAGSRWENLYVVDTATGSRRVLVDDAALAPSAITNAHARELVERYHIGSYGWTDTGDAIFVLKDHRLWLYPVEGGRPRPVGPRMDHVLQPTIAPGGHYMAWVHNGMLRYAPLAATAGKPVAAGGNDILTGVTDWVYREELGLEKGYAWSRPGGRFLAFLQFDERGVSRFPLVDYRSAPLRVDWQFYPHPGGHNPRVRLGIRDVATGRTVWAGLSVPPGGYIARFGWVPASGRVFAEVLNRAQTVATIDLVDPVSGAVRRLARKSDPWWVDVDDTPRFLKNGDFIWSGNRDGWHHLYLYAADGRVLRKLTPGPYNVLALAGVDRHDVAYFMRYANGPLDTRLYRVPLSGGNPAPVTQSPGVHEISMSKHARYFVDRYSQAGIPPETVLVSADGQQHYVLKPRPDLTRYELRPPHFVSILAADGKTHLYAELFLPAHFSRAKRYPVIMYQYGGPDVPPVVRNGWGGSNYLFDELLNRDGFIVFSVDNRSATYFSHRAQASIKDHFGPLELADQLAALKWLRSQRWVDPHRIGIWGWSFGGYMTAYALTHAPHAWNAGIAVAPVTAWRYYDSIYTERYMETPEDNPDGYRRGSVIGAAGQLARPLLLAAGTYDDNVHWQNTLSFIQALIKAGKRYQLAVYPYKSHGITGTDDRTQLYSTMLAFWRRELGGRDAAGR